MLNNKKKISISSASTFILMMGIVSLFSDMTHEGAQGIVGAYLTLLGANASAIGFVSGLGTLIGYGLRFLTGYLADKTKKYWPMTILGYAIDLLLIPFLALVPNNGWVLACGLLLFGKIGNAIKKPAKDTMVSFAASENGQGKGFAWLEFVDQIGAFLGPTLLFVIMLFTSNIDEYTRYKICFAFLAIPGLICMLILFISKKKFPNPEQYEKKSTVSTELTHKRTFIIYMIAVSLFALGFIDFPIITAHESIKGIIPTTYLSLLYSGAMLVDAFSALLFGNIYDKHGFIALVISAILAMPFALLIFFLDNIVALIIGIVLWGIGMGAQESIMKAAIATMTTKENRSKGYGVFQLCFGVAWFIGSWITGTLYDHSILAMVLFATISQLLSIILFVISNISLKQELAQNVQNN